MDWITWDASLDTGDAGLDAEHQTLANLFNRLCDAAQGGAGRTACAAALDGIIEHTRAHFELEQRMMTQHRYPKIEQHAAEHDMLLRQALDFRNNLAAGGIDDRSAVVKFAEVWLSFHILFSDKDLGCFVVQATRNSAAP